MVRFLLAMVLMLTSVLTIAPLPTQAYGVSISPLATMAQSLPLAATPVPASDITHFAKAYQAIQGIRDQAEGDMAKAVESEGLTVERFNAIAESQPTDPTATPSTPRSAEEQKFDAAVSEIIVIRQRAEDTMASAIEKTGLSLDRFNQILEQAEQDSDLYKRIGAQINAK
jgi:hypothetical protein